MKDRVIKAPEGGWEPNSYYIVKVSFGVNLQIHKSILYTGFISEGVPNGYNQVINPKYENAYTFNDAYYIEYVEKLNINLGNV